MTFRYVQERLNPNGSKESLSSDFPQEELLIGRGGDAHLILASRRVSLVHAAIRRVDGRIIIEDQNSLAGVRVNGRRAARAELGNGDVVQLGDVRLAVGISGADVTLTHQIEVEARDAQETRINEQQQRLNVAAYFPPTRMLSLFVLTLVVFLFLFFPVWTPNFASWSSGPISNPHRTFENDCQSCHAMPFTHVQDRECSACHNMTDHSESLPKLVSHRPDLNVRCSQCHIEHNGDHHMTVTDSRMCVKCHASIKSVDTETKSVDIPSFSQHPEFRIPVRDGAGAVSRIALGDPKAVDSSIIKLNHALHLKKGLRGKDGPVNLQCSSCHELAEDFTAIKPIKFEKHCRDCHTLGFDDRMPTVQVLHGDDEAVYPALFTEYTKLLLLKSVEPAEQETQPGFERTLPGGTGSPRPKAETVNASMVSREARNAETQLFTKTACFLCHDFSEKPVSEQTDTNSHFHVKKPEIPEAWLTRARFNHGSHEEISCESCHDKTRESTKTTDVLLPGVKLCQDCHAQEGKHGFVKSDCVLCHSYHDSLGFPAEKKKSIAEYLTAVHR